MIDSAIANNANNANNANAENPIKLRSS